MDQVSLEEAQFSHRSPFPSAASGSATTDEEATAVEVAIRTGRTADDQHGFMLLRISNQRAESCAYLVTVVILGVFSRAAPSALSMSSMLKTSALRILYPFAREAFANLTSRGRAGALWLAPILPGDMDVPVAGDPEGVTRRTISTGQPAFKKAERNTAAQRKATSKAGTTR